jgi:hypothetical protein
MSTESIWMSVPKGDLDRMQNQETTRSRFKQKAPLSDHLSMVLIFDAWKEQMRQVSFKGTLGWCTQNCLQHRALIMARDIYQQLK